MEAQIEAERVYTDLSEIRRELEAVRERLDEIDLHQTVSTGHRYVVRKGGARGGEPMIRGTALTVRAIVERTRLGQSPEQIAQIFPVLTLAQVYDALSYYHEHPEEIEQYIRENEAALWKTMPKSSS